ncbi:putative zinc finger protein [Orchesella cincta]|uniref:Putative zinc finger protein n=1 Tax=Orchesella cincta TaxID=48709 RepID=A0A1D2MLK7_ORCCI|nr:putative zinc finger protein [Orchesella cincta]
MSSELLSSSEHPSIADEDGGETTSSKPTLPDVVSSAGGDVDVGKRRCWDEAFESSSSDSNEEAEDVTDGTNPKLMCVETADDTGNQIVCDAHPGCLKSFSTTQEYEEHYNLRHKHRCSVCKRSLPSYHILELHVLEAHDTLFSLMAERKPMLNCFLESCPEMFWRPKQRKKHCLSIHGFPKAFKFWYLDSSRKQKGSNKGKTAKDNGRKPDSDAAKMDTNRSNTHQNRRSKNGANMDAAMQLDSDVSAIPVSVVKSPTDEMDIDAAGVAKTKQKSKGLSDEKKQVTRNTKSNSNPTHFTFGHSAPRTFNQKYSFGVNKCGPKHVPNPSSEEMSVDLNDMKDVLPTTSSVQ